MCDGEDAASHLHMDDEGEGRLKRLRRGASATVKYGRAECVVHRLGTCTGRSVQRRLIVTFGLVLACRHAPLSGVGMEYKIPTRNTSRRQHAPDVARAEVPHGMASSCGSAELSIPCGNSIQAAMRTTTMSVSTSLSIEIRCNGGIDKYPAKAHARRVAQQLQLHHGRVVLAGTKSSLFSHSDMPVPFRQDRYFYYLTGCNEPDCLVTYDLSKDILALYLPQVSWARFYYDGRGSTTEEAEEAYDIDEAHYLPYKDESMFLQHLCSQGAVLLLNNAWPSPFSGSKVDFDRLRPAMDACRAVKDEHEIRLIRKANEITAAAHIDVLKQLHKCKSEAEAEAVYLKRCVGSLAKEQSYEPIFGAGANASFLHYIQDDKPFDDSQVLLIDAGCEWQRYASDVTRTIPLNKKNPGHWPSQEAEQIYRAVERIQEQCISHMGAHSRFSSVNRVAQEMVIKELLDLGLLLGDPKDIMQAGTWRAFFPHGLGHHMGLEVHDVTPPPPADDRQGEHEEFTLPHSSRLHTTSSGEALMEKGNVITVEPGIYFNKFVLERFFLPDKRHAKHIDKDVLMRYMPVGGVRIEDDILIVDYGSVNLTTTPKGDEALQIIRDAAGAGAGAA